MEAKYLIFGNGYLGKKMRDFLPESFLTDFRVSDQKSVEKEIKKYHPEFVINCAGKTGRPNIDWCEEHKLETLVGNILVPVILAAACEKTKTRMVHIGSGCVYDGDNDGNGFSEDDAPNFYSSYYSRTKIQSESILRDFPVLQIRIRMPFDDLPHPRNLITKLLEFKKVVVAQNSMTYIPDFLANVKMLTGRGASGVFNVVNKGSMTHEESLKMYEEISGEQREYRLISIRELDSLTKAKRTNCVLSTKKIEQFGGIRDVHSAMKTCLRNYYKNCGGNL